MPNRRITHRTIEVSLKDVRCLRFWVDDEQPFHNPVRSGLPTKRKLTSLPTDGSCAAPRRIAGDAHHFSFEALARRTPTLSTFRIVNHFGCLSEIIC